MFRPALALVLAVLAFAGCSRVEAATAPKPGLATPNLPCSLPYGTQVALVSPPPGSSAAPAGTIVLVASRELPKTMAVVATDRKGGVTPSVALERQPAPAHAGAPAFPNAVYYRAAGIALHAHRHYTLALDDLAQNGCAPYAAMIGNPRFST